MAVQYLWRLCLVISYGKDNSHFSSTWGSGYHLKQKETKHNRKKNITGKNKQQNETKHNRTKKKHNRKNNLFLYVT